MNSDVSKKSELQKAFDEECDAIDQLKEYGQSFLGPRWLISTSMSEDKLVEKYGDILKTYESYMLVSPEVGAIFAEGKRINDKYKKQLKRKRIITFEQGVTDQAYPEISQDDYITEQDKKLRSKERMRLIFSAIEQCSKVEQSRFSKHYFEHKKICEIAKEENVESSAVSQSIIACRNKVVEVLESSGSIKIVVLKIHGKEIRI